jgi:hypothetical protein
MSGNSFDSVADFELRNAPLGQLAEERLCRRPQGPYRDRRWMPTTPLVHFVALCSALAACTEKGTFCRALTSARTSCSYSSSSERAVVTTQCESTSELASNPSGKDLPHSSSDTKTAPIATTTTWTNCPPDCNLERATSSAALRSLKFEIFSGLAHAPLYGTQLAGYLYAGPHPKFIEGPTSSATALQRTDAPDACRRAFPSQPACGACASGGPG